jgi:hypothetical protein
MTSRVIATWIGIAAGATVLAGTGYVIGQQTLRHSADHPQVEMARSAAAGLDSGASPASVVPTQAIDIAQSSEPFVIVIDGSGRVLASSATLAGAPVVPPSGVFDYVRAHGEDLISWQPAPGVRSAIVVDAYHGGFVVAGRSLKQTEDQESGLLLWAGMGWVAAIAVIGGIAAYRLRS